MNANELRLGNLVRYTPPSNPYKAQDLKIKSFGSETAILSFGEETGIIAKVSQLEGIPLTEEWLLKLGYRFYKNKESGTLCLDYVGKLDIDFYEGKIQIKSRYEEYDLYRHLFGITCVHHIQNLYFALSGEDLIKTS